MKLLSYAKSFFRSFFRRQRIDADLDAEVRSTVDLLADQKIKEGLPPDEARRAARIELGGIEQVKEDVRSRRAGSWLDTLLQDLRFGIRMLRKSPGFTAVVVITLAIGIGANTAVFSLVDAMFLRPWPVTDPSQIVVLSTIPRQETGFTFSSYPDYLDIRSEAGSFSAVAAYGQRGGFVSGPERGQEVNIDVVSENYFSLLGVRPAFGRFFFLQRERQNGNRQAVVLSYSLWRQQYGGDPTLVGRSVILDGKDFTVLGIATKEFIGLEKGSPTDLWVSPGGWVEMIPGAESEFTLRGDRWLNLVARLKPNAGLRQARAEMETLAARLSSSYPASDKGIRLQVIPAGDKEHAGLGSGLFLLAMVGLVLVIACANVANLLLGKSEGRQKEIALRQALGADRSRLVRQLLTESLLLAIVGGALGLLVAWRLVALLQLVPQLSPIQSFGDFDLDFRSLLFTGAASLVTAILFGLAPALSSSRADLVRTLKSEGARLPHFLPVSLSLRDALVTAEIALSVVLLVASGLLLRSLFFSEHIDPGFDLSGHVLMLTVAPPMLYGYTQPEQERFDSALVNRLETVPGVVRASYARRPPLIDSEVGERVPVAPPGAPPSAIRQVRYNVVSAGFFGTVGVHLLRGRGFASGDTSGSQRVVVINQMLARELWPRQDAVGRHLLIGSKDFEVAGVVEDGKYTDLHEAPEPYVFFPFSQVFSNEMVFFAQTSGDDRATTASILAASHAVAGKLPVVDVTSFTEYARQLTADERASATLLSGLSIVGMFLAAIGLYAVVAYLIARRTHEIGIRMALGARPAHVLRLVLEQAVRLSSLGAGIGAVVALAASRILAHRLYGVKATDLSTYFASAAIAVAIGVLACYIPARRAMKVDPIVALRHE